MSSVALANQIINWNQAETSSVKAKQKRSPRNIYGTEQKAPVQHNGVNNTDNHAQHQQPLKMYQQPLKFDDGTGANQNPLFRPQLGYGPTTREALQPDNMTYFRQNENINTIKRKKPKTPEHDANKPVNGAKTAATDVINEFRDIYMPTNGKPSPGTSHISPRPSSAKKIYTKYRRQEENGFSFISNDFQDPTPSMPIPKGKMKNENIIIERGNAIPVDQVLNSYKSTRIYKEQLPETQTTSTRIPHMTHEEVEREKQRNEELNARLRGYVPPPPGPTPEELKAYKNHIYQSLTHYNKDSNSEAQPGKVMYLRKPSRDMNIDIADDDAFSFQTSDEHKQPKIVHRGIDSSTTTPRAEKIAMDLNSNHSPYRNHVSVQRIENHYVLTEPDERKFDVSEVLNGYKSRHVYKKSQAESQQLNPTEIARLEFEERNQRNAEREQARREKLNTKLYSDHQIRHHYQQQQHAVYTTQEQVTTVMHYSNSKKAEKTPEPRIGPSKAELSSNDRFIEHRNRSAKAIERDQDGWVRVEPPKKVNPGPTTQARDYFNNQGGNNNFRASSPMEIDDVDGGSGRDGRGYLFQRTNSSKSNPNVTFGRKNGRDIAEEYHQNFETTNVNHHNHHIINHHTTNVISKSKSEPNLFGNEPDTDPSVQTTELNRLNFSNISSNIRRSQYKNNKNNNYHIRSRTQEDYTTNAHVGKGDNYVMIDNTKRDGSSRDTSARSTIKSNSSMQSFGDSVSEKNRTTVMLARGWSGKIESSSEETKQKYDYHMKIPDSEQNNKINELVFQNGKPIEEVQRSDNRKDSVLNSLSSLDRRLSSERSASNQILFVDSMDWMTHDSITHYPDPKFYRESKHPLSDLQQLNEMIKESGFKEGQDMRVTFYESLHKITKLVNQLLESIPKEHFPFTISPCSFQGDFEKKGPQKIDLYLNIEILKEYVHQVNFLMKKDLAAYILLKSENREKLKQFCARNRENGEWVLSAGRIMVLFAYIIDTKIRPLFDHYSDKKRKDIEFDAKIKFITVSESQVRINIVFPEKPETVYDIGLLLAFNVTDFPNVMEMNKNRQWPSKEGKAKFIQGGTHLIAMPGQVRNHAWAVSFLKTRKLLLNFCDGHQTATNILLAMQVINKTALSNRNCEGLLLPVHFIMILFWVHESYRHPNSWSQDNMSQRFIDVLIALKRCLEKKLCVDFFFPKSNYFEELPEDKLYHLLQNVNEVLAEPAKYLS